MAAATHNEWDAQKAIREIVGAAQRRPIVPFLGTGISIAAGFPTIRFVVQYLAKVDFAIRLGVYKHRFPQLAQPQEAEEMHRQHPSRFLEDFGWPDLAQLDADLWMWLARGQDDPKVQPHGGEGRFRIWKDSKRLSESSQNQSTVSAGTPLVDLLANNVTPETIKPTRGHASSMLDLRDHLTAIVQWTLRQDLAGRESGSAKATLHEWLDWKDWYMGLPGIAKPELLYGDWEALLDRLCEGNFDLTDALFTSFERRRNPTVSHRYLAFLRHKLGVPLILTTNFDSLLERALHEEGSFPKVFDIHRDAELPDAALVKHQFSVLKLHGSAYGLRLGERLKYPLDADARRDALQYIPHDALVVVIGFSGSERRIMQLLQAVVREDALGRSTPRLLWIQGPSSRGPLLSELVQENDASKRVGYCEVTHSDFFLQELFFQFAGTYQASTSGYPTLPGRPQAKGLREPKGLQPYVPKREVEVGDGSGRPASQTYGNAPFTVSATASSGLAVSFSIVAGGQYASISGNTITLLGAAPTGTVATIAADQAGNANYSAAPTVDQSFTIAQSSQTISFGNLSSQAIRASSASATSGIHEPRKTARRPVQLFLAKGVKAALDKAGPVTSPSTSVASMAAAAFATNLDYGYSIIWIDLENHHTVEGVLAEFFDKVRVLDPHAPTCTLTALPHAEGDKQAAAAKKPAMALPNAEGATQATTAKKPAIHKAVDRVREVFQRGRYVLVLDSVESFGRSQMMHHGMPTYSLYDLGDARHGTGDFKARKGQLERDFSIRVADMAYFMKTLLDVSPPHSDCEKGFCDSYVLVSVDVPRLRYPKPDSAKTYQVAVDELVAPLIVDQLDQYQHVACNWQEEGYDNLYKERDTAPLDPDPAAGLPPCWRRFDPQPSLPGRSQDRIFGALRLLSRLRGEENRGVAATPEGAAPSDGSLEDRNAAREAAAFGAAATAAFVGLLAIFRRPRTLPVLRSVVERRALRLIDNEILHVNTLEVRKAVDRLIAHQLTRRSKYGHTSTVGVVGQSHEGGVLWLFREVHETTYDALTEQLHITDWIAVWKERGLGAEPAGKRRPEALLDGLLSITWHLAAARTYYADVFLPTRDIHAFYEYLYHRVTATRTITLLLAILHTGDDNLWVDAAALVAPESPRAAGVHAMKWLIQRLGVFSPLPPLPPDQAAGTREKLINQLCKLREHALETLLMALRRDELTLRSVATPDTVLAWSQQFVERVLDDIRGDVLKLCRSAANDWREVNRLVELVAPEDSAGTAVRELEAFFDELQFRACMSKLDFEGALARCHALSFL